MGGKAITVDATGWPVLWATILPGFSEADIQSLFAELHAALARATPFVLVSESRNQSFVKPSAILLGQREIAALSSALRAHCLGFCLVAPGPVVRGIVDGVLHFIPLPVPHRVVATADEARAWAQKLLANAPPR